MIGAILLLGLATFDDDGGQARPQLPADWSSLPSPHYKSEFRFSPDMTGEVLRLADRAGCRVPLSDGWYRLDAEVALLIAPEGKIHDVKVSDLNCPPVERYTATAMKSMLKRVLGPQKVAGLAWYRTSINYSWER